MRKKGDKCAKHSSALLTCSADLTNELPKLRRKYLSVDFRIWADGRKLLCQPGRLVHVAEPIGRCSSISERSRSRLQVKPIPIDGLFQIVYCLLVASILVCIDPFAHFVLFGRWFLRKWCWGGLRGGGLLEYGFSRRGFHYPRTGRLSRRWSRCRHGGLAPIVCLLVCLLNDSDGGHSYRRANKAPWIDDR